ncbi:hypothetical protein HDU96_008833 [Phlyctochytrium bullatum]|nr:hypothetical protein HDU96_008833 [Phlyctochytrium bullatum]
MIGAEAGFFLPKQRPSKKDTNQNYVELEPAPPPEQKVIRHRQCGFMKREEGQPQQRCIKDVTYKDVYLISKPGANKVESAEGKPKTNLTAWCDQGSTPFLTVRASDGRTFVIGSTIAERIRRLLVQQDKLQSEIDNMLNENELIRLLYACIDTINTQIAITLVDRNPDLDSEDDPTTKEIKVLQELRKKKQEEIGRLKTDMRKGIEEAEAQMLGVENHMSQPFFEPVLAIARQAMNLGLRQVNKKAETVLNDWQKIQAAQKKERARAKIDDRISRAVRKLHLEAVDLLSRFDVVYLPKFDVKGMVKTTGNLGPMSKRILRRLRPAKFLDRLQRRMSLVGGGIFQPDESMTTQFRPLTGEIRTPGRKKVIKDVVSKITVLARILFTAVGPVFICIGTAIVISCAYMYFRITLPYHYSDSNAEYHGTNLAMWWIHSVCGIYLLINIFFNYYMAAMSDPGRTSALFSPDAIESQQNFLQYDAAALPACHLIKPPSVGHKNHRYFSLFLVFVPIGTSYYFCMNVMLFYNFFVKAEKYPWPSSAFMAGYLFTFLMSASITFAVGALAAWNLYLIMTAQTTIEYQNNKISTMFAQGRGETFINEYDLGTKRNFYLFFNISQKYPWYYALFPTVVPPSGDGVRWPTAANLLLSSIREGKDLHLED